MSNVAHGHHVFLFLQTTKEADSGDFVAPTFNQHLPANGKVLLIEDVGEYMVHVPR